MDNTETANASLASIWEGAHAPAAHAADRGKLHRAGLWRRRTTATAAFARRDDAEPFCAGHAGIRKRLRPSAALAANRRELARAGLLWWTSGGTALTAMDHPEAFRPRLASIGERPQAIAAFTAYRVEFHCADWRRAAGPRAGARFVDDNRAGRKEAYRHEDHSGEPRDKRLEKRHRHTPPNRIVGSLHCPVETVERSHALKRHY